MIKFDRTEDQWGNSIYTAFFATPDDEKIKLAVIEEGEWEMPARRRWEVKLLVGHDTGIGSAPDAYEDTLTEAKNLVKSKVAEALLSAGGVWVQAVIA